MIAVKNVIGNLISSIAGLPGTPVVNITTRSLVEDEYGVATSSSDTSTGLDCVVSRISSEAAVREGGLLRMGDAVLTCLASEPAAKTGVMVSIDGDVFEVIEVLTDSFNSYKKLFCRRINY